MDRTAIVLCGALLLFGAGFAGLTAVTLNYRDWERTELADCKAKSGCDAETLQRTHDEEVAGKEIRYLTAMALGAIVFFAASSRLDNKTRNGGGR